MPIGLRAFCLAIYFPGLPLKVNFACREPRRHALLLTHSSEGQGQALPLLPANKKRPPVRAIKLALAASESFSQPLETGNRD